MHLQPRTHQLVEREREREDVEENLFFFQSWEAIPSDTATFTPDITPLILAAHTDNYEVIKILLDRGAVMPTPHHQRWVCLVSPGEYQAAKPRLSHSNDSTATDHSHHYSFIHPRHRNIDILILILV